MVHAIDMPESALDSGLCFSRWPGQLHCFRLLQHVEADASLLVNVIFNIQAGMVPD